MEILKPGRVPSERTIRGTCTTCRAEVQWKQSEGSNQSRSRYCVMSVIYASLEVLLML